MTTTQPTPPAQPVIGPLKKLVGALRAHTTDGIWATVTIGRNAWVSTLRTAYEMLESCRQPAEEIRDAGEIVCKLQEANRHLDIVPARYYVDVVLTSLKSTPTAPQDTPAQDEVAELRMALDDLRAENDHLYKKVEALEVGARRYEQARTMPFVLDPGRITPSRPDKFDKLIDAAIAAAQKETK